MRHLKTWRWYLWAHTLIFFIVDAYTIIFTILKINENKDNLSNLSEDIYELHYIVGIIFIILIFF